MACTSSTRCATSAGTADGVGRDSSGCSRSGENSAQRQSEQRSLNGSRDLGIGGREFFDSASYIAATGRKKVLPLHLCFQFEEAIFRRFENQDALVLLDQTQNVH